MCMREREREGYWEDGSDDINDIHEHIPHDYPLVLYQRYVNAINMLGRGRFIVL